MAPSAQIGNEHAMFQPSHGTAPQLAGQNAANPLETILSAAMMFQWLAETHDDSAAAEVAANIERAVEHVLAEDVAKTADIGGNATTSQVAEAVVDALADCPSNTPA